MELCIQLSIIMLGKQLIQNNIFEIGVPYVMNNEFSALCLLWVQPSQARYVLAGVSVQLLGCPVILM